jgi:hypothetical protein
MGQLGMHSWCLFNAYHSAYLGAKGLMALLGVSFPRLKGRQVALDLCPSSVKKQKRGLGSSAFEEFIVIPLDMLEQRRVWEALQRILRMSEANCWDLSLRDEVLELDYQKITPPRNLFLYKANYWPLGDLALDGLPAQLQTLFGTELEVDDQGFLLRLNFTIYRLLEQLVSDLAGYSPTIKEQFEGSRCLDRDLSDLELYRSFVFQLDAKQRIREQ